MFICWAMRDWYSYEATYSHFAVKGGNDPLTPTSLQALERKSQVVALRRKFGDEVAFFSLHNPTTLQTQAIGFQVQKALETVAFSLQFFGYVLFK